jgi:hypothetical protein
MHIAGILPRDEEAVEAAAAGGIDFDAAHDVVGGRGALDWLARPVETGVATTLHHAGELLFDEAGAEMGNVDVDAAMWSATPGHDLQVGTAGDDVTCGAF